VAGQLARRRPALKIFGIRKPLQSLTMGSTILSLAASFSLYGSQHAMSLDDIARHDARSAQTAIEDFYNSHNSYDTDPASLESGHPSLRRVNMLTVSGTDETYVLSVTSRSREHTVFTLTRPENGVVTRTCDQPGRGGCDAHPDANGNSW
jgi:hypothetical protein